MKRTYIDAGVLIEAFRGTNPKAREYFYIDGNKKCFKTEADMLAALNCEGSDESHP